MIRRRSSVPEKLRPIYELRDRMLRDPAFAASVQRRYDECCSEVKQLEEDVCPSIPEQAQVTKTPEVRLQELLAEREQLEKVLEAYKGYRKLTRLVEARRSKTTVKFQAGEYARLIAPFCRPEPPPGLPGTVSPAIQAMLALQARYKMKEEQARGNLIR